MFGAVRGRPARLEGHLILVLRSRLSINPTLVGCATAGFGHRSFPKDPLLSQVQAFYEGKRAVVPTFKN